MGWGGGGEWRKRKHSQIASSEMHSFLLKNEKQLVASFLYRSNPWLMNFQTPAKLNIKYLL